MEHIDQIIGARNFSIIFDKLAEARQEQNVDFSFDLETINETHKTIALFKEFQDSIFEPSYSMFTRS